MKSNKSTNVKSPQCANCIACRRGTDLCPLEENYNIDKVLQLINNNLQKKGSAKEQNLDNK